MRYPARMLVLWGVASVSVLLAGPASAHESRQVGPYGVTVGWWSEPAFANQPNGPEIAISKGEDPVVEEVDLQVEVIYGDESTTYELEPAFVVGVFGDPGSYNADLVPTRSGTWEFHITGSIEGEDLDETFTSGPETFSDIIDPAELAFPAADPSNAELAERLERENQRLNAALTTAEDDASSARTFAYIGIGVGVMALLIALGLGMRGRTGRERAE
jgi:hypothetical protein